MKKINDSEDIKDDSDELRKKKSTAEIATDQMVPVPENIPFRTGECENIKRNNDEKNSEFLTFPNKECNDALETHDPLFASFMYEDVNSPEDFDDYDDDDVVILHESCGAGKTAEDSCDVVEIVHQNCDAVKSVPKCDDAEESTQKSFDVEELVQNTLETENISHNCFDAEEPVQDIFDVEVPIQDTFDAEETIQDCFEAVNTAQDHFSAEETIQDCFDSEEAAKGCFNEGEVEQEDYDVSEPAENSKLDYEEENYDVHEAFNVSEAPVNFDEEADLGNLPVITAEEPFESEDSSLPPPDDGLPCGEISPVLEAASTVRSVASVEEDIHGDVDEEEEEAGGRGNTEVIKYTFNTEEGAVNGSVEPDENFAEAPEERGIVPEVEDVTCDSGGETVLVMKHEACAEECDVSKPNVCTEEEMMYTGHINSVQSVNEMIFHKRSTVIDTGNMCASLHVSDSVMKNRDNSLVCELPQREAAVVRYCEDYGAMGVNSMFPKRVCSSVCISPVAQPPIRELYVYDPSAQNMTFCRNSTIIDARSLPVNPNLNGLDTYSFHQIPIESSSGIKNINDSYGHANTGICPVLPQSRFEFDSRDMKPAKKLPTEDDFMRRIEKTLFESKIETKIDDAIDSKYKAELDLSLPLKKRLRTLAAMSSISCTPEKFVTPKEESFPSYPVKPMISIAELEFTEGLIPKPGKTYQANYK